MDLMFGTDATRTDWQPTTTAELILEYDTRWSPELVKQRVKANWADAPRTMLARSFVVEVTVRAKTITESILESSRPVILKMFLLELIASTQIPAICPERRAKPQNYWKR